MKKLFILLILGVLSIQGYSQSQEDSLLILMAKYQEYCTKDSIEIDTTKLITVGLYNGKYKGYLEYNDVVSINEELKGRSLYPDLYCHDPIYVKRIPSFEHFILWLEIRSKIKSCRR